MVTEQPSEDALLTDSDNEQDSSNESNGDDGGREVQELREELQGAKVEIESLTETVALLQTQLSECKGRVKEMWRNNCQYVTEIDEELASKDTEIQRLQEQIQEMQAAALEGSRSPVVPPIAIVSNTRPTRRGKAPPVDPFNGEDSETTLDDWLPSLQRAAEWNGWAEEKKLMQLAGYLRGRARQEWDLLLDTEKESYPRAVRALQGKLEPANKILAAQDFRHISQGDLESVADFIRRLEHTFKIAYG